MAKDVGGTFIPLQDVLTVINPKNQSASVFLCSRVGNRLSIQIIWPLEDVMHI